MAERPGQAGDEERLPWLEPYRESAAARPAPARPAKRRLGLAAGAAAAVAAALTAGYYLGQRNADPTPPPGIAVAPITPAPIAPQPRRDPVVPPPPPPAPLVAPPVAQAPPRQAAPAARKVATAKVEKQARRAAQRRKIRSAGIESARIKAVRAAQAAKPAAPSRAPRVWPRMPSPGPAGQVIQLGAFRHPDGAYRAYRTRLARYPALGRMPRVVVPVVTGRRGRLLYVLRLGTSSRQQSRIVCRNLRASGDHCLVIG